VVRRDALHEISKMRISTDAKLKVLKKIEGVGFSMPLSTKARAQKISAELDEKIENLENDIRVLENASVEEFALMVVAAAAPSKDDRTAIQTLCESHYIGGSSDYTLTLTGKISVSWQSIKNKYTGYGVMAHEMGHVISAALRETESNKASYDLSAYEAAKTCTAIRHGLTPETLESHDTEEDFADLFAAHLTKRQASLMATKGNFGCILLGHDSKVYGPATGLELKHPETTQDVHSTSFYRLIQQEMDLGRSLPSSCQKIVDEALPSMKRSCI